jgi:hypothetical protein
MQTRLGHPFNDIKWKIPMATQSYKPGESPFILDGLSADAVRKEFIETPLAAAQQPAINTGLDLLAFMTALPNAIVASEQRELKRLLRTTDDNNDDRIERLKLSIERTNELHTTVLQGKARIDRVLVSLSTEGNIFHGFVSDADAKPMAKLTVRIFKDRTEGVNLKAVNFLSGIWWRSLRSARGVRRWFGRKAWSYPPSLKFCSRRSRGRR